MARRRTCRPGRTAGHVRRQGRGDPDKALLRCSPQLLPMCRMLPGRSFWSGGGRPFRQRRAMAPNGIRPGTA
jgi:hypothetical protein